MSSTIKSLYFKSPLFVLFCFAISCSQNNLKTQTFENEDFVLGRGFSDTIYAENSMLVFKNGNLERVFVLDEYYNKFQRIDLNSENGLFGVSNLENDSRTNLYYDFLNFSRDDEVNKDTKPFFYSYLFEKLSIDKKTNLATFHFDLINTRPTHNLLCIHVIGDEGLLTSQVFEENTGNLNFNYSNHKFITVVINQVRFLFDDSDEIKYNNYRIIRAYSVRNYEVARLLPMPISNELEKNIGDFDLDAVMKRYNKEFRK